VHRDSHELRADHLLAGERGVEFGWVEVGQPVPQRDIGGGGCCACSATMRRTASATLREERSSKSWRASVARLSSRAVMLAT
jgi:hypothetical protein